MKYVMQVLRFYSHGLPSLACLRSNVLQKLRPMLQEAIANSLVSKTCSHYRNHGLQETTDTGQAEMNRNSTLVSRFQNPTTAPT